METSNKTVITVENTIDASVEKVWDFWNKPEHIIQWCSPSPEWHTPRAENDLTVGGKFNSRMEAKNGSMGFDFWGIYDSVKTNELIEYTMGDGRNCKITFTANGNSTKLVESFEAESENPIEMQKLGWQAILDSFKKYAESK